MFRVAFRAKRSKIKTAEKPLALLINFGHYPLLEHERYVLTADYSATLALDEQTMGRL